VVRVKYNTLVPDRIFIGSEGDAQDMVDVARCDTIIDLRGEAAYPAFVSSSAAWIHVALNDHTEGQEEQIKQAIGIAVDHYTHGKIIGIHCASGICRTAAVAIGVLIELGYCKKVKEALEYVEITRTKISIHPYLKKTLQNLYK
jgi:protein-tyrosine phosphatase